MRLSICILSIIMLTSGLVFSEFECDDYCEEYNRDPIICDEVCEAVKDDLSLGDIEADEGPGEIDNFSEEVDDSENPENSEQ